MHGTFMRGRKPGMHEREKCCTKRRPRAGVRCRERAARSPSGISARSGGKRFRNWLSPGGGRLHRRIRYEGEACSEWAPRIPITLKADTGRAKPLRARSPAGATSSWSGIRADSR